MNDKEKAAFLREMMATEGWGIFVDEINKLSKQAETDLLVAAQRKKRDEFDDIIAIREYHHALVDFVSLPANLVTLLEEPEYKQEF